jgi:phage terminase small subunit
MQGRKPSALAVLSNSHPGGGRKKHVHRLPPLTGPREHLNPEEREVFELVRTNSPHGLLAEIDKPLVEVFARHVVLHRRAFGELEALTFDSESSKRPHPLVGIANDQVKLLLTMAEALGLTASARQRIRLPEANLTEWDDVVGA